MEQIAGINRHTPFYKVTPESLHRMAVTKCNLRNEEGWLFRRRV